MAVPKLDLQAVMRHPPQHFVLTCEGQEAIGVQGAPLERPSHTPARAQSDQEALVRALLELCAQGAVLCSTWFLF